jgi:hypothetical protein
VPSQPLLVRQKLFRDTLCDDVPQDLLGFETDRSSITYVLDDTSTLQAVLDSRITIADLLEQYKQQDADSHHPIVVRVVSKSRCTYFTKPDSNMPYPVQAYLEVVDASAPETSVVLVLWSHACTKYYARVQAGDVIAVNRYRTRRATSFSRAFCPGPLELALDSSHPCGEIVIITAVLQAEFPLHVPPWGSYLSLIPRQKGNHQRDGAVIAVAGVLFAVGRIERRHHERRGWSLQRWVALRDGSCALEWNVLLFYNSMGPLFANLRVGDAFLLTRLEVGDCSRLAWVNLCCSATAGPWRRCARPIRAPTAPAACICARPSGHHCTLWPSR